MNFFIDDVAESYDEGYREGYDHKYPNENIVRLIGYYLHPHNGKVLDYGFGFGANAIHLAESGYFVECIDVAKASIDLTNKKLQNKPQLRDKINMKILTKADGDKLPYASDYFDGILSNQTVYYLGNLELIKKLLKEFLRILKPNGKMIISLIDPKNTLCKDGKEVEKDVYEYVDITKSIGQKSLQSYVFRDEQHIREVFHDFIVDEIGYWDNNYGGRNGFHYVLLCRKPAS